jgi:branched-chain amino acid aminotransferase
VIEICREHSIPVEERNLSLTEFYNADEVFACGTMGELTPVVEIDGRKIRNRSERKITEEIHQHFQKLIPKYSERIPVG